MKYVELIKNAPDKSEDSMWKSVESVGRLIDEIREIHPEFAEKWMIGEYERLYGSHFNQQMAIDVVDKMWHKDSSGNRVEGELASFNESVSVTPDDESKWDAYVGVNAFMHDLANVGLDRAEMIRAAESFWFDDVDFSGDSKVFWYFKNQ